VLRRVPKRRGRADPMIALINVVFLLLIFLMVAGTVAPALNRDVELIDTTDPQATTPPDAAVVLADGRFLVDGAETVPGDFARVRLATGETELRIVPDRDLPAASLIAVVAELRRAGATEVWIITERSAP
jgi:biopolymer transport protein ExbD